MQSTLHKTSDGEAGLHVALIMDGNGRWALRRGMARPEGHRAGVEAVRRVVAAAPRMGVGTLTLYAFSCANWRRPAAEVSIIFELLRIYLEQEAEPLARAGVRCSVIGRRDRLPAGLLQAIRRVEEATREGGRMRLRLAIDYSSRGEIAVAAGKVRSAREERVTLLETAERSMARWIEGEAGQVDLVIRTGGEQRLSDFLLWESAYAELVFTRTLWPEFGAAQLRRALSAYARRERRFGGLGELGAARSAGQP